MAYRVIARQHRADRPPGLFGDPGECVGRPARVRSASAPSSSLVARALQRASPSSATQLGRRRLGIALDVGSRDGGRSPAAWQTTRQEMAGRPHRHQQGQARRHQPTCSPTFNEAAERRARRRSREISDAVGAARRPCPGDGASPWVASTSCVDPRVRTPVRGRRRRDGAGRHQLAADLARTGAVVGWTLDFMRHRTDSVRTASWSSSSPAWPSGCATRGWSTPSAPSSS